MWNLEIQLMKNMKHNILLLAAIGILNLSCSKDDSQTGELISPIEEEMILETESASIHGTLTLPQEDGTYPIVLIIAGSGPTDRNGNNNIGLSTNTYKLISDTLAKVGIASLRYDKRGVGDSFYQGFSESELIFDDYVDDATKWVTKLKEDPRFSDVLILGHSEGALIGSIVAAELDIAGFISVAGTAQRADLLLLEQLSTQTEAIKTEAASIINSLNNGILVEEVSQSLLSLFRLSVQPYLISWFKYDPKEEIAKIADPVLIIHGDTDLQVNSSEAELLGENNSSAQVEIISGMNHVLKNASLNTQENLATYSNPDLPLTDRFVEEMIGFIQAKTLN